MTDSAPPVNPYVFTREDYNALVKRMSQPVVSTRSEYEEIELVEDCTLFDMYRQPRPPVTDPKKVRTLPVRVLNQDLMCPVCLGIIRHTQVVMECLHRFCSECIQKCIRLGKKECPSCRIQIPSRRSLRYDANFDELIAKIYPNLDEFQRQEEELIAKMNQSRHFNNAMTKSTTVGVQNQETLRRNGGKKRADSSSPYNSPTEPAGTNRTPSWLGAAAAASSATVQNGTSRNGVREPEQKKQKTNTENGSASTNGAPSSSSTADAEENGENSDKVNLRVLLHPDEQSSSPRLERTLFRTSYKLKIRHLKKHIGSLLKLESIDNMRIVLSGKNATLSGLTTAAEGDDDTVVVRKDLLFDQELEEYVSLYDIYQQYGMGTKWELQLLYHFSDTIVNGVAQFIANGV